MNHNLTFIYKKGQGTKNDPYIIENLEGLNNIRNDLSAHYQLGCDIEAKETKYWNGGRGFIPVGTLGNPFTGELDGMEYKIKNLYINQPSSYNIGLFGCIGFEGKLIFIKLTGYMFGYGRVGGIAGINYGTISNCYWKGKAKGNYAVGGIVGHNHYGIIENCYSAGKVSGKSIVGKIAGINWKGTISNCYSTGNHKVGQIVGWNNGIVSNCYLRKNIK